jgi:hypothetical protein
MKLNTMKKLLSNLPLLLVLIIPMTVLFGSVSGHPDLLFNLVSQDYVNATAAQEILTANNELLPSHPGFERVLRFYFCPLQDKAASGHDYAPRVTKIACSSASLQDTQADKNIQFHWSYGVINEWPLDTLQVEIHRLATRLLARLLFLFMGTGGVLMLIPAIRCLIKTQQIAPEARR